MDTSIYFNDLVAVSSIDIHDADTKEILQILNEICNYDTIDERYGNENFKLYHKNIEVMDERDEWKAKYEAECQQTDILKKTCDELSKDLKKSLDDFSELTKDYDILLKDRNRLFERLHELSEKFEKGEQE